MRVRRAASLVSDTIGPLPVLAALCGAGAIDSSNVAIGVAWGILAMGFAAVAPYLATWRIRHPTTGLAPSNAARSLYMALAVVAAGAGLLVLWWAGAPAKVISVVTAVLVSLAAASAANALWRWSNHMAACSAGVAMLMILFGAAALISAIALPAVAWARMALGRHQPLELLLGALLGALVSAAVLASLL